MGVMSTAIVTAMIQISPSPEPPGLDPVRTLPAESDFYFGEVTDIDGMEDGAVAVLDNLSHHVAVFDSNGRLASTLGREGRGPGELMGAREMELSPSGDVYVLDYVNRRATVWKPDGQVSSFPLADVTDGGALWPGVLAHTPSGLFIKMSGFTEDGPVRVVGVEPDFSDIRQTLTAFTHGDPDSPTCGFLCPMVVTPDGRILAAAGDTLYRISELAGDGRSIRSWERHDLPAARRTEATLERLRAARSARQRAEGGDGDVQVSPFLPRIRSMDVDGKGRLWVLPSVEKGLHSSLDVFGPDGPLLETLGTGARLSRIRVRGSYLFAAGENDAGEPTAYVFRIVD